MTDYFYEPESEAAEADDARRRPANRYPVASAFSQEPDDDRLEDVYADDFAEVPYPGDEPAAGETVEGDWETTQYYPDEQDYPDEQESGEPYSGEPEYDDEAGHAREPDPGSEWVAPPPTRGSIAESGATATRRIRFDPTQERGADYFERARRHSRTVRSLKVVLPGLAILGVVGFVTVVQLAPGPDTAIISLSGIDVDANSVTMDKPNISGFEGTHRAYEVSADRAVQDLQNPNLATLDNIDARLGMGNGETARILATKGAYNGDADTMNLYDGIRIQTSSGHTARLETADINIKQGTMVSSKPLEITTDQLNVKANAVEVQQEGKHIWFRNGVTVVFTPPAKAANDTAAADPKAAEKVRADGSL